jgi:Ca-activated chloride channel family protein
MPPDFAHPEWAQALLLLLTLVAGALIAAGIRARRRWRLLLGPAAPTDRSAQYTDARLLAALVAIGIALLGPRIGTMTLRVPASGIDLVMLVDVSLSMDARDTPPSRLARARAAAGAVLDSLEPGDHVALAAFAGRGVLLTPLTPDRSALAEMLPALDSALMADQGSHLASGIEAALGAFDPKSARPRALLIASDGEVSARSVVETAGEARQSGARVISAAFGTEAGGQIPVRGGSLRSASGETVVSRRETRQLALLADASGGRLFRADRWGVVEIGALVDELRRDTRATSDGWIERRVDVTRFGPFAALALALLLLEGAPRLARRGAAVTLALLLCCAPGPGAHAEPLELLEARVRETPEDAAALLRLGAARALSGAPEGAKRAFLAAAVRAGDDEIAALAYYDLGVVALEQGDLESARDAFFDAIALAPDDVLAKFNLEWTLRALEAAPSLPPAGRDRSGPPGPEEEAAPGEQRQEEESATDAKVEPERRASAESGASDEIPHPPPELDPERARHWLETVEDDPGRALRNAATAGKGVQPRRGPRW